MATIRKRNDKWQAQVRRTGYPAQVQSFASKADAQRWARTIEANLDKSLIPHDIRPLKDIKVCDLLTRYRDDVSVKKRGAASEKARIKAWLQLPWSSQALGRLTPQTFSAYRDQRLKLVSPGTVIRELGLLRSIFEIAKREWGIPLPSNPLALLRKPKAPEGRDRRLRAGELAALQLACNKGRSPWLWPAIQLAIETGMRRGELLNLRWKDIDLDAAVLSIPVTKTGVSRRIPLTQAAVELLQQRKPKHEEEQERAFPVSVNAFQLCWERCRGRAAKKHPRISDLRFHDLRHEAVSRFFEMGLSTVEVALISGHRDLKMLFRYTHLKPEDVVLKLRQPSAKMEYRI